MDPTKIPDINHLTTEVTTKFATNFDTWINNQINNDFLIASIATFAFGILLYLLRHVPLEVYHYLKKRCTIHVQINNQNALYEKIAHELDKNSVKFLSRTKSLDNRKLTIGFSTSVARLSGSYCFVSRVKEQSDSYDHKQFIELTFPFASHKKVERLFEEFFEKLDSIDNDKTSVYSMTSNSGDLEFTKTINKRLRESVYVKDEILDNLEKRIDFFAENKDWYKKTGIPYKFNILLHGPPGTGKTTLLKYIAAYTNRDIIFANPNSISSLAKGINRKNLWDDDEMAPSKERKYICVLEDIDCFENVQSRDDDDEQPKNLMKSVTTSMSDVLNVIDGLNTPNDLIIVATTNHIEKLDSALLRKGRFDEVIKVDLLEKKEIMKMFSLYFPDNKEFLNKANSIVYSPITGSNLQDLIITYSEDPEKILENL